MFSLALLADSCPFRYSVTIFCRCFSFRTSTMTMPSLTRPRPTSSLESANCRVT
uniref:Uncharacterized protein n=1 Tax=Anguilla anguilla TaxID=7936 RepID=A0A0E9PNK7_ANGAN